MRELGMPELFVVMIPIFILIAVVALLPWFFIYKKAGYHPAMGCLMFLPLVNVVMLYVLAFSEWPMERKMHNQQIPPAQIPPTQIP